MKSGLSKSLILITVILMDLLAGMEFDLFVPSFPELQSQFHLTAFWVEALLSINFLGYCLSLFFVGGLGDQYGRKPIIVSGLITFIMGSLLCLWVTFYPVLLIGRLLQGIGVAAPAILSFLIVADLYPLKEQQFFMAMLNGVKNTSVAIAPVIGSYITLYFHWQGNFITLLLLGCITCIMSLLILPSYKLPIQKEKFSLRGYLPLMQSKSLLLLVAHLVLMFVPYWIFVGMAPVLYIKDLGISLRHFGYYQGVLALVFAIGSVLFGFIMHKYQQKELLRTANMLYWISLLCVVSVSFLATDRPLIITLAFLPFIISQIIPSNLLVPLCLNFVPEAKGKISALLQGSQLVFSALSLQLAGYLYHASFQYTGIIIAMFILMIIISQFFVVRDKQIITYFASTQER